MSPTPSNDNTPGQYTPNLATAIVVIRYLIAAVAGTAWGVKYLPPEFVAYLNTNIGGILAGALGLGSLVWGAITTLRRFRISAAAAQPGAVVLLDSQKEAEAHANDPSVIGPTDPIPATDPKKAA